LGTCPAFDRRAQHTLSLRVEIMEGISIQSPDARPGMEADLEENLVGVYVADPGEDSLVHQRRLDLTPPPFESLSESREIQAQWVKPQLVLQDKAVRVLDQVHFAEQPLVVEGQMAPVAEGDQDPGMGRLFVPSL
jgi:hypothetical protein